MRSSSGGRLALAWLPLIAACGTTGTGDDDGEGEVGPGGKADSVDQGPDGGAGVCPYDGNAAQMEVFFTRPTPGGDLRIEDEVVRLSEAAVPGSRLRVAIYHFKRLRVADAFIAAHRRGVDVRIVVDETNQAEDPPGSGQWRFNDAITLLREELGTHRVVVCGGADVPKDGGACMGDTINHNKFILASELCDGSRDVVAQSSANFTTSQLELHNNLVVIRGDTALHTAYARYWNDLATDVQDLGYYRIADGDTGTRVYLFPRRPGFLQGGIDPETDTIHQLLASGADCAAGTRIRFAESIWTPGRIYIVDLLRRLADEGCDVQIVYNNGSTHEEVKAALHDRFPGPELRQGMHIHHKYFLVEGRFEGAHRRLLWTGSHNLTYGALRNNDETLLRIDDAAVYEVFLLDWQFIWDHATPNPI